MARLRKVDLNADWVPFLAVTGRQSTSFHPDGRQVAFVRGAKPQPEIWALENFLPTLGARPSRASVADSDAGDARVIARPGA